MNPRDITVKSVSAGFEEFRYRMPYMFGGRTVDKATLLHVYITAETGAGHIAIGFGSVPLGTAWGWPSSVVDSGDTLKAAMLQARKIETLMNGTPLTGHPVALARQLEDAWFAAGQEACREMALPESMPLLCSMICSSAFDAALHDVYGKAHEKNVYDCYSGEYMTRDLGAYLDDRFAGEYLDRYTLRHPTPVMPLFHSVGASDPLRQSEITAPVDDGLPEYLEEWIIRDRLTHFKIKLNGHDLAVDINRVLDIDRVTAAAREQLGRDTWHYSLDFNEQCENAGYVLAFLHAVREKNSAAFDRILYVEQPTARDLKDTPEFRMHEVAALKPVVIDESLTGYDTLLRAVDLGYTGVALKVCKGQTGSLLMAAAAQKLGLFLCVQDLTCFGASYMHMVGLAARIPGVTGMEGNGRQFLQPAAYRKWARLSPWAYTVMDGYVRAGRLTHNGLGHAMVV